MSSPERGSSRISGFYQKSLDERGEILARWASLDPEEQKALRGSLSLAQADKMVENVVGRHDLPLGIGTNFLIDGKDYLIPMAVEEPSVIAAVSYAARLSRQAGGFRSGSTEPIMIGQVQLLEVEDRQKAQSAILGTKSELLALADVSPTISRLGGGPLDIEVRDLSLEAGYSLLVVHLIFDCRDAMGANAVNSAVERIAPLLERLSGGRALLRILSNYSDRRRAWSEVEIPVDTLSTIDFSGDDVAQGIVDANRLAEIDPYRAATHNKGIFNGIDAVLLATGNDWRAAEAGAHAYASRHGRYTSLTRWELRTSAEGGSTLWGRLEIPLAVGIVGGATRSHPTARVSLKILGVESAQELSQVIVSVGLAQNLAALRALVTDGIQAGHMRLHARQIAIAAGASAEQVDHIADQLVEEGSIRVERARQILERFGEQSGD